MAITPGGNIVPCQSWLDGIVLGDMRTDVWEEVWDSEQCAAIRAHSALMDGTCPLRKHAHIEEVAETTEGTASPAEATSDPEEVAE